MDNSIRKVLAMIQSRKITAEEGNLILENLEKNSEKHFPEIGIVKEQDRTLMSEGTEHFGSLIDIKKREERIVSLSDAEKVVIHFPEDMSIHIGSVDSSAPQAVVHPASAALASTWLEEDEMHFHFESDSGGRTGVIRINLQIPSLFPLEVLGYSTKRNPESIREIRKSDTCQIMLADISADITVKTKVNDIIAKNLKGKVNISTISADIKGEQLRNQVRIETRSGDITLTKSSGEINLSAVSNTITLRELEGDVSVHSRSSFIDIDNIEGAVNIQNTSGKIKLADIRGTTKIQNRSGALDLDRIEGNVKIETVSCPVSGNRIKLEECKVITSSGDILLLIDDLTLNSLLDIKTNSGSVKVEVSPNYREKVLVSTATESGKISVNNINMAELVNSSDDNDSSELQPRFLVKTGKGNIEISGKM